ncbi:glycosyltransferase family 39 protein [Candidatus Electronema sp. PJ]|uniref:glycosyltransferase family 39 protein n=1 Tax=Candidatus Electronema sp. PJ TaxID=3401572 RepID=UPI003AA8EF2D
MTEPSSHRLTWLVLALGLALRLLISGQFLLTPDEANYWQWSRYLDIGYYDHPPMIAWTIWLATQLFGQTEFAVRLPTVLGISVASVYLCLLASRWFSWRTALQVALVSQSLLLLNGSALIATPDGLLLPCWAAACYYASLALEHDRLRDWLRTGLCFGLGLLSKYTMLLFLPSLFCCLIFSKTQRGKLLTWQPWLGLLAGLSLFTPVIIWNAQHNWVTFRHTLFQGGANTTSAFFTLAYLPEFFGSQAGLLSPLIFLLLLARWLTAWQQVQHPEERIRFLLWLSLPGFLVFCLLALHVRIYGNWPAPAYLTALILIAALDSLANSAGSRLWYCAVGLAMLISAGVMLQLWSPVLPVPVQWDRTAQETKGWDELAQTVDQALRTMQRPEQTFVFGLRYQVASELAFYMQGQPRTVSVNRWSRPNVYDFWFDDQMLLGMDAVGVHEYKGMDAILRQVFKRVAPEQKIVLYRHSPWFGREAVRTLYLVRCWGFKGGLRWLPKEVGDIRAVEARP